MQYTALFLLRSECIEKFGDMVGKQIWEAINDCFDAMPVAAIVDDKASFDLSSRIYCPLKFLHVDFLRARRYSETLLRQG